MRKYKKLVFYIVIIILVILVIIYFYPRSINKEYSGIMFRTGENNYSEHIKVKISGNRTKGLFKGDKFDGVIIIGDRQLNKINMRFDKFHNGNLYYYDENTGQYVYYGNLISSNLKDGFTICVLEGNEQKNGSSSWSSKTGLMISVPASTRNEALNISNVLMKDMLE